MKLGKSADGIAPPTDSLTRHRIGVGGPVRTPTLRGFQFPLLPKSAAAKLAAIAPR
jgi:hypothetical protein